MQRGPRASLSALLSPHRSSVQSSDSRESTRILREERRRSTTRVVSQATGARRGELVGLTWDRVDLRAGTAFLEVTKSGERRTLPIRGPALKSLTEYSKVRRLDSKFVFPSLDGRKAFSFRPYWERAVTRAELEDFRFHDLRHTTASYLAMNGATLIEIADVLGHKTLEMVKRYAHLADSHKAGVLEKMNIAVFGEQEN